MTMHNSIIKTDHLLLSPFQKSDIDPLYEIQCNPKWMQYTYCADSLEKSKERLYAYSTQRDQLGYAPWTVSLKSNKKIIGWGGLNVDPFESGWGTEVAYFFHPDYWGKGFATELVQTALEYGFTKLGLNQVNAYARRENYASIRVLEKCGLKFLRYIPNIERNHYRIET